MPSFEVAGIDVVPFAAAAVAAVVLWAVVRRATGKRQPEYVVAMRCRSCGWKGSHSKYNKTCPACARPMLEPTR